MKYKLLFLDTETTGNQDEDRVTQVAYTLRGSGEYVDEMFKPPLPVKVEAMEVTHITNRMLEGKPPFADSPTFHDLKKLFDDQTTVMIAHNAPFDTGMLEKEDLHTPNVIDTLRVARALDTDAKLTAFRLQYLRYLLDLDAEIDEPIQAHDAKGDVIVLEKLFDRLFAKVRAEVESDDEAVEKMIDISQSPVLIRRFSFGKHNGRLVQEVAQEDKGYLEWLYKQKTQSEDQQSNDSDWIFTLETFLKQ